MVIFVVYINLFGFYCCLSFRFFVKLFCIICEISYLYNNMFFEVDDLWMNF